MSIDHEDDVLCIQCADGAKPCTCGYRVAKPPVIVNPIRYTPIPEKGTLAWELTEAHKHAAAALTIVYKENPPSKKWFWRVRLLKAESILMSLMVKECSKRGEK